MGRKIVEGAAAGLYTGGQVIMSQSQILVPVEFGVLKRSGRVEEPELSADRDSISVTVGYGYGAAYQDRASEEDPGDRHGYGYWVERVIVRSSGRVVQHKPPTQARFLEVPAKAFAPEFEGVLAEEIKRRVRS